MPKFKFPHIPLIRKNKWGKSNKTLGSGKCYYYDGYGYPIKNQEHVLVWYCLFTDSPLYLGIDISWIATDKQYTTDKPWLCGPGESSINFNLG